jgi:hypothetical protein
MGWASFRRKYIWLKLDENVTGWYDARYPYVLKVWYHKKDGFLQMHEEVFRQDFITDLRRTSQDDLVIVSSAMGMAETMTRRVSQKGLPLVGKDHKGRKETTTYPPHRIVKFEVVPYE